MEKFAPDFTPPPKIGDWSDLFSNRPSLCSDDLTSPFSLEEIKLATFQLGGDKAPGPDDFSLIFFQKFWDVIKLDLFKIFVDLFEGTVNTAPLDYSHICLIPKKEGAKTANDFKPICLINFVQKIISKVLANRLESKMHEIISPSQTAFLKGRSIYDSFVTASERLLAGEQKCEQNVLESKQTSRRLSIE